jgi:hypothetical protein
MQKLSTILNQVNITNNIQRSTKRKYINTRCSLRVKTEIIADSLVEKFNEPQSRKFFLKVAWRLDKNLINRLSGLALEVGKNPGAYFVTCCKKEFKKST